MMGGSGTLAATVETSSEVGLFSHVVGGCARVKRQGRKEGSELTTLGHPAKAGGGPSRTAPTNIDLHGRCLSLYARSNQGT